MLEHAIYSVASPEACASIVWRSSEKAEEAAEAMKLTAKDLIKLNIIDEIIEEPIGGAHRNSKLSRNMLGSRCYQILKILIKFLLRDF